MDEGESKTTEMQVTQDTRTVTRDHQVREHKAEVLCKVGDVVKITDELDEYFVGLLSGEKGIFHKALFK